MQLFTKQTAPQGLLPDIDKLDDKAIARAFTRLFAREDGRIVLAHLQGISFGRALPASSSDQELRYAEGQRALIAQILRLIDRGRLE